jgi:DNA polymerase-3 subunit beta
MQMKFIVSSSYLLKQLQVLGSVINSSNTLPILDNFLFELKQNQLVVSASDLETTMFNERRKCSCSCKVIIRNFKNFPRTTVNFYS